MDRRIWLPCVSFILLFVAMAPSSGPRNFTLPGPSRIFFIWSLYLISSASSFRIFTSTASTRRSVYGAGFQRKEWSSKDNALVRAARTWPSFSWKDVMMSFPAPVLRTAVMASVRFGWGVFLPVPKNLCMVNVFLGGFLSLLMKRKRKSRPCLRGKRLARHAQACDCLVTFKSAWRVRSEEVHGSNEVYQIYLWCFSVSMNMCKGSASSIATPSSWKRLV